MYTVYINVLAYWSTFAMHAMRSQVFNCVPCIAYNNIDQGFATRSSLRLHEHESQNTINSKPFVPLPTVTGPGPTRRDQLRRRGLHLDDKVGLTYTQSK